MKPIMRKKLSTALVLALGTGVLGVTSAQAQQATRVEKIEVTGSNIKRVDAETAAPIQIISREEIENSGKLTVGEYLQTLTVDSQGSVPPSFGNGFAPGSVGISLRGLGASSTLVLLNGRRIAPYGLADDGQKVFTDLSTIPMNAVERIEILKDGASAIYGSDAIAGVVNVILRKDYRGVTGQASFGTSRYSDADQQKASLLVGFGDLNKDRYNAFVNVDYSKSDKLQYTERLGRRDHIGAGDLRPYGYDLTAGQFIAGYIVPGAGNASSSLSGSVRDPVTGLFQALPGCSSFQPVITPADPEGGCLFNAAQYRSLMPETETWNLFTRGTFAISNALEGYAELSYSKRETAFDNTPTGVSGSWGFPGGPVNATSGPGATVLAATHPDNPLRVGGVRPRVLLWDLGPRTSRTDNEAKRFSVGFKGAAAGWDFDTAYVYSETELENRRGGFIRYSQILAGLNDPTSALFPFRIGANANLNTQAQRDAISPIIKSDASSKLQVLDFKAARELMNLAGGPMGFAGGLEFRREETSLTPTTYTDIGDIVGLGYSAYSGKKNVVALYGELLAPVTSMIELSGAVRHDHYSVGENSTTPKLGIKITPTRQIALRGTYAEGFRQPNAAESGVGGLAAFTTTRDPVRCPGGTPAAGANAGDCTRQVAIITTPDPSLKPEKSKNYSVGFVFEPFQSTSISVDFWQIKRTDEINQTSVAAALAANTAVVRSDDNLPGRPGTGTLLAVSAPYVNSNSSKVEGVDLDFRHRMNLGGGGRLTFETRWTRLNKFQRTESDGTTFEWAGTHGNCDVTNCVGTPKDRVNVVLAFDAGPLTVTGLANYRGSIKNVYAEGEECATHFANGDEAPNGCRIASFTSVDLSLRYRFLKNLEVFGTVQNLFDRVAPFDPTTYGALSFNPLDVSGAIGRYYTVGLKYAFK
jgi:iron complex outermembrane receptor protein